MEHIFLSTWLAAGLMHRKHCAVGTGHAVCKCELQVQGYPLPHGYVLHPEAVSMQGYHRLLTSCIKLAKSPGNLVLVLGSLMNLKSLESCVNNL